MVSVMCLLRAVAAFVTVANATAATGPACTGDACAAYDTSDQEVLKMKTSLLQTRAAGGGGVVANAVAEDTDGENHLYEMDAAEDEEEEADVAAASEDVEGEDVEEIADDPTVFEVGNPKMKNIVTATIQASCEAYKSCGKYNRGQDCQCSQSCHKYGNCCKDYKATCATCKKYGCSNEYNRGQECQCSTKCKKYENCCEDYVAACVGPTPPPTPRPPSPPYGIFECESNSDFGSVAMNEHKGIALDDTTFQNCAHQLPRYWPGTKENVLTVRLFKVWGMTAPLKFSGDMMKAWKGLKGFAKNNNAKFLLGVSVTCNKQEDEAEWKAGRDFIRYVGAEHIMGIAVGNEIDLQVGGGWCKGNLWNKGEYTKIFHRRVKEFHAVDPALKSLPITAVLSMNSLNNGWTVKKFLKDAQDTYGSQFVFSINIYPQFSAGLAQAGCQGSIDVGSKFSMDRPAGFMPSNVAFIKEKLQQMGLKEMKIWVGEVGWSTHSYCRLCPKACHDKDAQKQFYSHFLKWNLGASEGAGGCGASNAACKKAIRWTIESGIYEHPEWFPGMTNTTTEHDWQIFFAKKPAGQQDGCVLPCDAPGASHISSGPKADHAFYFTLRDSSVFGQREEFGIIEKCGSTKCKF